MLTQLAVWMIAVFVLAYVLGSIPFGLLLTRAAGLGDIRTIGSGNIGATNVLRTGNKGLAAATLLLDAAKGMIAVLALPALVLLLLPLPKSDSAYPVAIGWQVIANHALTVIAGLGAFLGHLYPVWLRFKGGKGVATYVGVLLALSWPVCLVVCAVWLAIAFTTRHSSAASLIGALVAPVALLIQGALPAVPLALALMSALLIWKHRDNIGRLWAGTESRIGGKT